MNLLIKHQELQPIEVNLDEIKKHVAEITAGYQAAVYTDEQIKLAKEDRTTLNKLKKQIEEKRKEVKKRWNEPYLEFEAKIKEITTLIDTPVLLIDGQIKDYEERKRKERLTLLENHFNKWNYVGDMISFETLLEASWLTQSVSDKKAIALLSCKLEAINKEVSSLEAVLEPGFRTECLAVYCQTLSMNEAIARQSFLKAQKEKQDRVLGSAEQAPLSNSVPQTGCDTADIFSNEEMSSPESAESRRFVITATNTKIVALKKYCFEQNIKIREVI